jgi:hypothetical protein
MKDIDFTFGIITDALPESCLRMVDTLRSIKALNIPRYEVIIVGAKNKIQPYFINEPLVKIIDFNENIKPMWITKKDNIITQHAQYDNIVYSHDYFIYDAGWYNGWKEFGDNYHACMNRIINIDGTRFRDWCIYDHWEIPEFRDAAQYAGFNRGARECLIPYNEMGLQRFQYLSGAYWVAKKSIMQEIPLNENLVWGQGEDLVWAIQYRKKYSFSLNTKSVVKIHKKPHAVIFAEMSPKTLSRMKEYLAIKDGQNR